MQAHFNKIADWVERYLKYYADISSIKVNVDDDGNFVSARFGAIVEIDIEKRVQQGDIPTWAIQHDEYNAGNSVAYYQPVEMNIGNAPLQPGATYEPIKPLIFQRWYRIGVPFELVTSDEKYTPRQIADMVKSQARQGAYEWLETRGNVTAQDGEITRYQVPMWAGY